MSFGNTETRPSNAARQSINAKEPQLCTGSVLFACELKMQERMKFRNRGRICFTMKFSPKRPPENYIESS